MTKKSMSLKIRIEKADQTYDNYQSGGFENYSPCYMKQSGGWKFFPAISLLQSIQPAFVGSAEVEVSSFFFSHGKRGRGKLWPIASDLGREGEAGDRIIQDNPGVSSEKRGGVRGLCKNCRNIIVSAFQCKNLTFS